MKKYIPLELSLAQRLAAAEPETRFCGFCRTEQAAVEELKEVMAKPAAELLFSPSLAHLEELEKRQGFGTVDVCDPLDKAVLSARMPGPAPAEDGPNRQMEAYATAASDKRGSVYHPLHNIAEWRKGCSCAVSQPGECLECTNGLIEAIERWFEQEAEDLTRGANPDDYRIEEDGIWLRTRFLRVILLRTGEALGTSGRPGLLHLPEAAQKLRDELDQAHATVKEMGELIDQQTAEIERLKDTQARIYGVVNEIRGTV